MSNLSLRHLYKVYPNGVKAVNDFNMEIEDKEFIVFVGPSGCGKSTTLRMIAGLEDITAGELYIGDTFSNHVEPKDRDIAMVFQNYALYPHMTVYENLAFGLQLRHVPQAEIHKKVLWAAKILKLEEYLERKPKNLSGGQRQRVSLGRAILRTPKVFLLDEPLSNLDAKLRTEMRAEIAKLHQEIGTTFIYVTHDQVEAMTMGTRIVVMSMGYVQQIDTPQNLYNYPENKFVAGFIGTPQMNFFPATLRRVGNIVEVRFEGIENVLTVPYEKLLKVRPEYLSGEKKVIVGLRCEQASVDPEVLKKSTSIVQVKISHFEELGNETLIYGDMNLNKTLLEDSNTRIIVKQYGGEHSSKIGDVIDVALDMEKAHFFDAETEKTIAPRIPVENVFDTKIHNGIVDVLGQQIQLPKAVLEQLPVEEDAASILVPTNALRDGGSDFKAVVVKEENIKGQIITHLAYQNRTFFMVSSLTHRIGEDINLGIDFKSVSIYDKNQRELVKPLPQYDTFYGSYFDNANAKRSNQHFVQYYEEKRKAELEKLEQDYESELSEVIFQPSLLKKAKDAYVQKRKDIEGEMSYRLGTEDLGKEGKKNVKAETEKKLAAAKEEYEKQIAELEEKKSKYHKHIYCAECGTICRRKMQNGQAYWVCRRHDQDKNDCPTQQVSENTVKSTIQRFYHKIRLGNDVVITPMLSQLGELRERELRTNNRISDIDKEMARLAERNLVLNRLKEKGYVDPALYQSQQDEINGKALELRRLRRKLMERTRGDETIRKTEEMLDYLEDGPEWLEEIEPELFETLIDRLMLTADDRIKFCLINGLELTESIERTVA